MVNRKALAPYAPPVPTLADVKAGVKFKPPSLGVLARPYIEQALADEVNMQAAVSINGADSVFGSSGNDKALLSHTIATAMIADGIDVKPAQYTTINRAVQSFLSGSGNSRSQRRAAARAARDSAEA